MATQAIPHPPLATFGPGPASFKKNPRICEKGGGFEKKVADFTKMAHVAIFGESVADFPQIRQFFNNSEVNNFLKKHFQLKGWLNFMPG
jgi:hypothetical protein